MLANETAGTMRSSTAPSIEESTREDRLAYVRRRYQCISNCDLCGICATFGGEDPERALCDYVDGKTELRNALVALRNKRRGAR